MRPNRPATLQPNLPNYPVHIQVCRVTASTVSMPSISSSSSAVGLIYVSFTEQVNTETLALRDREPCLVLDPNGAGLSTGYYVCRLIGNYNTLPLYATMGKGGSGGGAAASVTTTTTSFTIPAIPTVPANSSTAAAGGDTVTIGIATTTGLYTTEILQIVDTVNGYVTIGQITSVTPTTVTVLILQTPIGSPGTVFLPGAFVVPQAPWQNPVLINPLLQTVVVPGLNSTFTLSVPSTTGMYTGQPVTITDPSGPLTVIGVVQPPITPTSITVNVKSILFGQPGASLSTSQTTVSTSSPVVLGELASGFTANAIPFVSTDQSTGVSTITQDIDNFYYNLSTGVMKIAPPTSLLLGVPSLPTNATAGFPSIPVMAGVPIGIPTLTTGYAPMVVDSTDSALYGYVGGSWKNLSTGSGGGGARTEGTLVAAGTTQGDAAAITTDTVVVSGADGTTGVILPSTEAGMICVITNSDVTNALNVYPPSGAAISSGSTDAAYLLLANTTNVFLRMSTTQWRLIKTVT